MECYLNYLDYAPSVSQKVNQNCIPREQVWPTKAQSQNFPEFHNNVNQKSMVPCQENYTQTKPSPVTSASWRKEASIADWEAYLYNKTNAVNTVNQIPATNSTSRATVGCNNYVPPRAPHQAHISFAHTSDGVLKPIVKRKRKRTAFTTEQVQALESVFYKRPYVSREERQTLTNTLQVSDKAIKVWFQNRRLKEKREKEELEAESSDSEPMYAQEVRPLAYVEAQIRNADEFGFVTLDDRAMNELVSVIDHFLPMDTDLSTNDSEESESPCCGVSESESNSVVYEPISPPDLSDSASQEGVHGAKQSFEAIEPGISLQNLLLMHNIC